MPDIVITIPEPAATSDVEIHLRRNTVNGTPQTQLTVVYIANGQTRAVSWDPTSDVAPVRNACRDLFQAAIVSARPRMGF